MEGQLMPAERALLNETVRKYAPNVVLEIGTWKGGGSTYSIYSALQSNQKGHLYTCELDEGNYNQAVGYYKDAKGISLYNCYGYQLIEKLIAENINVDFAMFDGSEDPKESLDDFKLLDDHLKPGAIFMAHDWDLGVRVDGMTSTKNQLLRPYIENHSQWKILKVISHPLSVGLVCAQKLAS